MTNTEELDLQTRVDAVTAQQRAEDLAAAGQYWCEACVGAHDYDADCPEEVDRPLWSFTGNANDLRLLRRKIAALYQAAKLLYDWAEFDLAKPVRARADAINSTLFRITVPCMLCGQVYAVVVPVAGNDIPARVICDECDERCNDRDYWQDQS